VVGFDALDADEAERADCGVAALLRQLKGGLNPAHGGSAIVHVPESTCGQ
jgi:hypothetical protein